MKHYGNYNLYRFSRFGIKRDDKIRYILIFAFVIAMFYLNIRFLYSHKTKTRTIYAICVYLLETDKKSLINAFIEVESNGVDSAINKKSGAAGCLQIMPILIDEANRLSGYEKYTLNDRFSREKSEEIFYLIMDKKNPKYDLHLACKIWNPKSKLSYHMAIEKKYKELRDGYFTKK